MSVDLSTPEGAFGIASLVLLLALIAVRLSRRFGMPSLLLYLGIGLVLGIDAFGLDLTNALLTEQLGFVALVFILAEGGLTTRWENVRPALGLGISLATVSVVVSIAVAGLGVHLLLGFDWRISLALGGRAVQHRRGRGVLRAPRGRGETAVVRRPGTRVRAERRAGGDRRDCCWPAPPRSPGSTRCWWSTN